MVMTMYSTLKSGEELSMSNIEQRLDGNICRCTGYRPILDACKSLASDSTVVDHVCKNAHELPAHDPAKDPPFPEFLGKVSRGGAFSCAGEDGSQWVRATTLGGVFEALAANPEPGAVKLIVGNTCHGIYKEDPARVFVDLQYVHELTAVHSDADGVTVGAAASITSLHRALKAAVAEKPERACTLEALAKHVLRVANVHVRNAGSVGGNLAMAKTRGFLSDLSTILLGIDAQVTLASANGMRTVTMEEFLAEPVFAPGEIAYSIRVPFDSPRTTFLTYKAALRAQNSHAYVNAAIKTRAAEDGTVEACRVAVGGVMRDDAAGSHALLAGETAAALVGQKPSKEALAAALAAAHRELCVDAANHDAAYRKTLLCGFIYKHVVALMGEGAPAAALSASRDVTQRAPSRGSQSFTTTDEHGIVAQAVPKISAGVQATGEARFTDDIALHANALFGIPVLASIGRGKLLRVDASAALAVRGVVAFVSAADIERLGGKNNCSAMGQTHTVLVSDVVSYHSQPIGVIVAESERIGRRAAKLVKAEYDTEGKTVVKTIDEALAEPELFGTPIANEHVVGDTAAAFSRDGVRTVEGEVRMGEQKHFYMEPQVAYAVPDEDGAITMYFPNQWPDAAQSGVAMALGLPMHKVNVVHRRGGGGFGGKLTHAIGNAAMAAVCAVTVARPVRMALDRNTDMRVAGGREEMQAKYKAAFKEDGTIVAFEGEGILNAGWLVDLTWFTSMAFANAMNEAYGFENMRCSSKVVLSNMPARTVVRGPGEIEASYLVETVIEHVAHATGLTPEEVRERNFYRDMDAKLPNGNPIAPYTIRTLWEQLQEKAKAQEKRAAVEDFNRSNRWKKRGLACTPVRYEVGVWQKNALVNIYGTDGTVLVTHSGSEIGQGLNTKVAQAAAYALGKALGVSKGIPLSKIRFGDIQTNVTPNGTFTGGSTGSEGTAAAVMRCCDTLTERMKPVVEELRAKKESEGDDQPVTWEELCAACKAANVNLSAQDHWSSTGPDALHYQNYGVALSMIELDVITGEVNVLCSNLLYDCGKSLNPAIDIGQCEGAFLMGVGHFLRERMLYSEEGEALSDGTWEYKPPGVRDVPEEFTVELLHDAKFERGILSSKSSGEPPLVLSTSVMMAVRHAIREARREVGSTEFFSLPVPCTPADIVKAAGVDHSQFTLE
eukprot:TRINITY_DN1466_c0_g1_i1.p1 TRINITY_DN1466_c0_g1~~TRINITY_DN1466_c0_g1_i1.p1  ORF type:complete len:1300 (-),score=523.01 TRINITY_DN1466_c0_g1_i1:381-3914(-)